MSAALARWMGRQRQTGSLALPGRPVLRRLIGSTQDTRFGPFVTPQTFELSASQDSLASGRREYDDGPRFFTHFPGRLSLADLDDRDVLDLGCGYGGRTVYYAANGRLRSITGIEISEKMVARCRRLAEAEGVSDRTAWTVGVGESLPYEDEAFDAVLSYDVIEHVQDPVRVAEEMMRVLRPGGDAWLVFPTYLGARSSHLDYVTQIPALHRIFDPEVLIDVVNEFLGSDPARYGVKLQPRPEIGTLGRRALPSVNGMNQREAAAVLTGAGFEIAFHVVEPMITENAPVPLAGPASSALRRLADAGAMPDLLVGHLVWHLRKPR